MNARRFTLQFEDDDTSFFCAAWPNREARDRAVLSTEQSVPVAPVPPIATPDLPRPVGRPSFDVMIGAAVAELGAQLQGNASERARAVLRHLARDPDIELPSTRTVREWLAQHVGENVGNNIGENYPRARMRPAGGE
jgi:hypothetical protein